MRTKTIKADLNIVSTIAGLWTLSFAWCDTSQSLEQGDFSTFFIGCIRNILNYAPAAGAVLCLAPLVNVGQVVPPKMYWENCSNRVHRLFVT